MHSRKKRTLPVIALGTAALLMLSGCAGAETPGSAEGDAASAAPVKLVVNVTALYGYTTLYQALDLQPEGVEVEYITSTGSSAETTAALEAGQIDISDNGDVGPVTANAAGSDIKVIACTNPNNANIKYLVKEDSGIDSFADLVGKKVAGPYQTNHGLLFVRQLEKNGLTADDVEWVNIYGPDAETALRTGEIDAQSVNAPESIHELEKYPELKELDGIAGTVNNRYCLQSAGSTIDKKKDAIASFLTLATSAALWAKENPEEAAAITQKVVSGYSIDTLAGTYELSGTGYQVFDDGFFDEAQSFADELRAVDFLDADVDVTDVFLTDFNEQVKSATASIPTS